MIQRVQTLFLLGAIACSGFFLWLPLIRLEMPHAHFTDIRGYDILYRAMGYLYYVNPILSGTAIGLTLINIFLFKNRPLQMMLCWFSILFIVAAAAYVYYQYTTFIWGGFVVYRKWNGLALLAVIFEILAFAFIRKDEETVKSLDRLR